MYLLGATRDDQRQAGDNAAAQKMGWLDSVRDKLFNAGAKQAALEKLAQELDDKTTEMRNTMVQALFELNAPPNQHIDFGKLFSQRYYEFDPPPPPQEQKNPLVF